MCICVVQIRCIVVWCLFDSTYQLTICSFLFLFACSPLSCPPACWLSHLKISFMESVPTSNVDVARGKRCLSAVTNCHLWFCGNAKNHVVDIAYCCDRHSSFGLSRTHSDSALHQSVMNPNSQETYIPLNHQTHLNPVMPPPHSRGKFWFIVVYCAIFHWIHFQIFQICL